jgi:hypothetical protein
LETSPNPHGAISLPKSAIPPWACSLVQGFSEPLVSRLSVPRARFAVASRPGHAVFPSVRGSIGDCSPRARLSSSFAALRGLSTELACRGLSTATPPAGFVPLWHASTGEVRFTRALPARHLPSSGFGYPLDGLLPRRPSPIPKNRTAPMGFAPSELGLDRGHPAFRPNPTRLPLLQISLRRTNGSPKLGPEDRLPGTSSVETRPIDRASPISRR